MPARCVDKTSQTFAFNPTSGIVEVKQDEEGGSFFFSSHRCVVALQHSKTFHSQLAELQMHPRKQ